MSSRPTGFFLPAAAPLHDTGWGHPEHQGRLRSLASTVGRDLLALHGKVVQLEAPDIPPEALSRVHSEGHLSRVRRAVEVARSSGDPVALDSDTRVSADSWDALAGSSGALVFAVERIFEEELANAFVAGRPPGHHATASRAMGFCLVNHVAVAARHALATGLARRVAIVDWDVHHGNGTQEIFYRDPDVFYLSLHQSPHYPGTGSSEERGEGPGEGTTLNIPLPAGIPRDAYQDAFEAALNLAEEAFEPDLVLVSAGYDALAGDPLGGFVLEPRDFHGMTRRVMAWAERAGHARVAAVLEGGYDPGRTGLAVVATLRALAGVEPDVA